MTIREGGLDIKFNTYRGGGGITFSFLFANWKIVEESLEFKYKY